MSVAGADLSITKAGLAYTDAAGVDTLVTIRPAAPHAGYRRLRPMAQAILQRLKGAELVAIEGYDPHPRGYLALVRAAELGGIVRAGLLELEVPWVDVPPSTLKRYAVGKGNATKEEMVEAALLAGIDVHNDDEADAYWLRRIALELLTTENVVHDALKKVAEDLARSRPPRV